MIPLIAVAFLAIALVRTDERLLAALRNDPGLQPCSCLISAAWLDESYPRITVDPQRWRALSPAQQMRFGARALSVVQRVYLAEWGTPHFYQQVFIVDRTGRQLYAYVP